MVEQVNAVCSICGKGYYQCLSCKDNMKLHPWKIHTDTSEHYKIYQIIHGFSTGVYTKEDANAKLKRVDLSDLESFRDNIKDIVKKIMNEAASTGVDDVETSNEINISTNINNVGSVAAKTVTNRRKKSFEDTKETSLKNVEVSSLEIVEME